jgi:hypothetical protein
MAVLDRWVVVSGSKACRLVRGGVVLGSGDCTCSRVGGERSGVSNGRMGEPPQRQHPNPDQQTPTRSIAPRARSGGEDRGRGSASQAERRWPTGSTSSTRGETPSMRSPNTQCGYCQHRRPGGAHITDVNRRPSHHPMTPDRHDHTPDVEVDRVVVEARWSSVIYSSVVDARRLSTCLYPVA